MKKIIKGKMYDTDTARCVGTYYSGTPGNFETFMEEVYCKKTGEYFFYGEGGPMSEYAVQISTNSTSGGAVIRPLSCEEARKWCEQYLSAEDYIAEFGDVSEQEDIDKKIKKIRQISGLTQEEFSKKYNIPLSTLKAWELGERVPPAYVVELLEHRIKNN